MRFPGSILLPGIRLAGSLLFPGIRLPRNMLLPGIILKFANPFSGSKFEEFYSPGGAYSWGVDMPGVCFSRGVYL